MAARRRPGQREVHYEYGFITPDGGIVTAGTFEEMRYFVQQGGRPVFRECEVRIGPWTEATPKDEEATDG